MGQLLVRFEREGEPQGKDRQRNRIVLEGDRFALIWVEYPN